MKKTLLICISILFVSAPVTVTGKDASFRANVHLEAVSLETEAKNFYVDAPKQRFKITGLVDDNSVTCYGECDAGYQFLAKYDRHKNRSKFWYKGTVNHLGASAGESNLGVSTVLQVLLPQFAVARCKTEVDVQRKDNLTSGVRLYSDPITYEHASGKTYCAFQLTQSKKDNLQLESFARYAQDGKQDLEKLIQPKYKVYSIVASGESPMLDEFGIAREWDSIHYASNIKSGEWVRFLEIRGHTESQNFPALDKDKEFLKNIEMKLWPYEPSKAVQPKPQISYKYWLVGLGMAALGLALIFSYKSSGKKA